MAARPQPAPDRMRRRAAGWIAGLLCLISPWLRPAAAAGGDPAPLLLERVRVVDAAAASVSPETSVLIAGNRVAAVGAPPAGGARRFDGGGRYLIPGLWDLHVHTLWAPIVRDTFLPLFVAHGVTGVRDMGGDLELALAIRDEVERGVTLGPRIVAAGPMLDGPEPIDPSISLAIGSPAEARRAVERLAAAGVDFIKVYTLLPADAFYAVMAAAAAHHLPVAGHVPAEVGALAAAEAGMASIEHMQSESGGYCDPDAAGACDELIAAFLRLPTPQTPTLAVRRARARAADPQLAADPRLASMPPFVRSLWLGNRRRKLDERPPSYFAALAGEHARELRLAALLHRRGVQLLAGSDAGSDFSYPGSTLIEELRLLTTIGLTPAEALASATLGACRFLRLTDCGAVAAGMRADLVLLDENPLADAANLAGVRAVVRDGRLLDRAALDAILAAVERAAGDG